MQSNRVITGMGPFKYYITRSGGWVGVRICHFLLYGWVGGYAVCYITNGIFGGQEIIVENFHLHPPPGREFWMKGEKN